MNESVLSKLSNCLAENRPALCAWVTMNEPAVAESLAREAFDAIVLDMQHGAIDFDGATRSILRIALAGKPTIARVPIGAFALASQLMDSGACGILAPMIDSGEDARRLVEAVKFPPLGQRSWGPRAALPLSGLDASAYLKGANAMTQAIAMIETRAALDALDEILSVEGLDGVYVGPSDLSIALSNGASLKPRGVAVMSEAARVVDRAKAHGKYAAMFCFDGADARAMLALGFRLCTISSDQTLLRAVARSELAAARAG
ncbi:MAG: 4-hydroxy-2-oxoheptanedioate aldolase [Alphaproteobacteria bacterium]|jgi:4-hydroxy-2-oxoheptanedioate aldolase|nr:4-hydroxy-2-oxoheptanedioate aldolase [Alphaproteobacteria bacterium]